jgi:hypothetical protein
MGKESPEVRVGELWDELLTIRWQLEETDFASIPLEDATAQLDDHCRAVVRTVARWGMIPRPQPQDELAAWVRLEDWLEEERVVRWTTRERHTDLASQLSRIDIVLWGLRRVAGYRLAQVDWISDQGADAIARAYANDLPMLLSRIVAIIEKFCNLVPTCLRLGALGDFTGMSKAFYVTDYAYKLVATAEDISNWIRHTWEHWGAIEPPASREYRFHLRAPGTVMVRPHAPFPPPSRGTGPDHPCLPKGPARALDILSGLIQGRRLYEIPRDGPAIRKVIGTLGRVENPREIPASEARKWIIVRRSTLDGLKGTAEELGEVATLAAAPPLTHPLLAELSSMPAVLASQADCLKRLETVLISSRDGAAQQPSAAPLSDRALEVVLWEGASATERNIRLARTRTAYLEAHGDVTIALASLAAEGHKLARSTFYNHLDALDDEMPGWRSSLQLSNAVGNLDSADLTRTRRKPAGNPRNLTVQPR